MRVNRGDSLPDIVAQWSELAHFSVRTSKEAKAVAAKEAGLQSDVFVDEVDAQFFVEGLLRLHGLVLGQSPSEDEDSFVVLPIGGETSMAFEYLRIEPSEWHAYSRHRALLVETEVPLERIEPIRIRQPTLSIVSHLSRGLELFSRDEKLVIRGPATEVIGWASSFRVIDNGNAAWGVPAIGELDEFLVAESFEWNRASSQTLGEFLVDFCRQTGIVLCVRADEPGHLDRRLWLHEDFEVPGRLALQLLQGVLIQHGYLLAYLSHRPKLLGVVPAGSEYARHLAVPLPLSVLARLADHSALLVWGGFSTPHKLSWLRALAQAGTAHATQSIGRDGMVLIGPAANVVQWLGLAGLTSNHFLEDREPLQLYFQAEDQESVDLIPASQQPANRPLSSEDWLYAPMVRELGLFAVRSRPLAEDSLLPRPASLSLAGLESSNLPDSTLVCVALPLRTLRVERLWRWARALVKNAKIEVIAQNSAANAIVLRGTLATVREWVSVLRDADESGRLPKELERVPLKR